MLIHGETSALRTSVRPRTYLVSWGQVVLASVAMTATLPGRTHGLGLITEPLIADLHIDRPLFGQMNFAACLIGSLFCFPVGRWLDTRGVRSTLTGVVLALGISVFAMAAANGPIALFLALVLVRGLGQSALSVVSLTMVGKWFPRRSGAAMGVFAVLLTFGFIASILAFGELSTKYGWRSAWSQMGVMLVVGLAPLAWLVARDRPGSVVTDHRVAASLVMEQPGRTLREALRTPSFWTLALGISLFNLVWSGLTLFNESIVAEQGFERPQAIELLSILTGTGLLANLLCGAFLRRERLSWWLAGGLALLAGSLASYPQLSSLLALRLYAAALGVAGGVITVVFFAGWGQLFGQTHLGKIQGAAQGATVVASALGPMVFAEGQILLGGYAWVMRGLAVAAIVAAVAATTIRATPRIAGDSPKP
ncbi:MAG: MFS transporter [Planctomycetaceae bacterium]|nr:MFS transporter [Planctomycetaceae bacterium]